jgi:hypothetical protein
MDSVANVGDANEMLYVRNLIDQATGCRRFPDVWSLRRNVRVFGLALRRWSWDSDLQFKAPLTLTF